MAHKKGEGSTQNNRDSKSKRLGIKLYGGQVAKAGNIIIRQRGLRYGLGENVYIGKDFTVHAAIPGRVVYKKGKDDKTIVGIVPFDEVAETIAKEATVKTAKAVRVAAPKAAAKAPAAKPVVAAVAAPVETKAAVAEAIAKVEDTKADEITFDSIEAAFDEPAAQGAAASTKGDDLKKIEGIGPKIAELFNNEGIFLFSELANTPVERMQEILDAAGSRYRVHNPSTWAQQAQMAANGQWDELKVLQDQLNGGKED